MENPGEKRMNGVNKEILEETITENVWNVQIQDAEQWKSNIKTKETYTEIHWVKLSKSQRQTQTTEVNDKRQQVAYKKIAI